ncbi:MAG: aminoacyl-histidine dipeptidase [Lachnospiraceae bacterium]|nr:aminoacyl-histidine dipeptidase [Lachnospiraceae bacterium]
MGILSNLEPEAVFRYFEQICSIPHGSGNTGKISNFCVSFAKEHGLEYKQDNYNNVIIWKDGSPGYENSPSVMIQGHLDMVCEKETYYKFDFEKSGLDLQLNDGVISAKGTTLGGDDGIAIAYALAILESDSIPHPPLEAVFTTDEEVGMTGAAAIDASPLKSRIMLNIDSEEEGYLLVSCAGGAAATVEIPVKRKGVHGIRAQIWIKGLKGGHSGVEIDKGRANSNILMGRTLYSLSQKFQFNIMTIYGGLKDNAIPRDSYSQIIFDKNTDMEEARKHLEELNKIYSDEYSSTDAGIKIVMETDNKPSHYSAFNNKSTSRAITALVSIPNGVQRMSNDIEGLVQTSLNLGKLDTVVLEKEHTTHRDYPMCVQFNYSLRSSVSTEKKEMADRIKCLAEALGGTVSLKSDYPAWEYKKDSPLRDLMTEVFEEQYGRKPVIQAIHAGLECGLFAGKLPGLDCVSYGPDIKNIHTTQEYLDVESVKRTWKYTLEILKRLK